MKLVCNNVPRDIVHGFELTEKERAEFDYLDSVDDGSFFRFKGKVYDLGEFMRITPQIAPHPQREGWEKFHGYSSDSFFSGLLVRYVDSFERVIVATYYA
jgi:hypothetical protein